MKLYIDINDWWIGYYRGKTHHYICPLPTVVLRLERGKKRNPPACRYSATCDGTTRFCEPPNEK